ncbi:syncytin-1-like [Crotalus tigris]|uniref:syncytin-1-like n=2 Tax=Crotalus tigris TaxID=88082 RepID=UPI00192F15C4|nr:syncytin-1-like [Crotalus tigris]
MIMAKSFGLQLAVFVLIWFNLHHPNQTSDDHGPWAHNSFMKDVQNISRLLNKTECWMCMHIPTLEEGGLFMHAVPFNTTGWKQFPWSRGTLSNAMVNYTVYTIGSRIQEKAAFCWEYKNTAKNSVLVGRYPYCNITFQLSNNMTRPHPFKKIPLFEPLDDFSDYMCTYQITGCSLSTGCYPGNTDTMSTLFLCSIVRAMARQTVQSSNTTTNILSNVWMLCGRRAYQRIPPRWSGRCTLGFLAPSVFVSDQPPSGRLRNRRDLENGLGGPGSTGTQIARSIFPSMGVAMNYRDIYALNNWTMHMFNATIQTTKLLNKEVAEIREIVLQNRYALDIILASKGGVCALIHSHCCVYISDYKANITGTIEHMEDMVRHDPLQSDGSGAINIWDALWSWLPDGTWLRSLVSGTVTHQQVNLVTTPITAVQQPLLTKPAFTLPSDTEDDFL